MVLEVQWEIFPRFPPIPLRLQEIHSATEQEKHGLFGRLIKGRWGTSVNTPPTSYNTKNKTYFEEYSDGDKEALVIADI